MWKITDSPAWSLGFLPPETIEGVKYQHDPSSGPAKVNLDESVVALRFLAFLRERLVGPIHGFWQPADVRAPWNWASSLHVNRNDLSTRWHHDGDSRFEPEMFYLIVCSNHEPTEWRKANGRKIFQAEPWEVVAIRNDLFKHRSTLHSFPKGTDWSNRWFFRAGRHVVSKVQDVPGVFALDV